MLPDLDAPDEQFTFQSCEEARGLDSETRAEEVPERSEQAANQGLAWRPECDAFLYPFVGKMLHLCENSRAAEDVAAGKVCLVLVKQASPDKLGMSLLEYYGSSQNSSAVNPSVRDSSRVMLPVGYRSLRTVDRRIARQANSDSIFKILAGQKSNIPHANI